MGGHLDESEPSVALLLVLPLGDVLQLHQYDVGVRRRRETHSLRAALQRKTSNKWAKSIDI